MRTNIYRIRNYSNKKNIHYKVIKWAKITTVKNKIVGRKR
jgi:hypothetical protein